MQERDWTFDLPVTNDGVVSLPPEIGERADLYPGDILSLESITDECLSLVIYRKILDGWEAMDRVNLWRFIEECLSRPLTAVEPAALPIPVEVFPLVAGEWVRLRVFCVSGSWFYLWLTRKQECL